MRLQSQLQAYTRNPAGLDLDMSEAMIDSSFVSSTTSLYRSDDTMAASTAQAHDLWKKAVDFLDLRVIARLDSAKNGMHDIVSAVLRVAKTKRDESVKKLWRMSTARQTGHHCERRDGKGHLLD